MKKKNNKRKNSNVLDIYIIALAGGLSSVGLVTVFSKQYFTGILELILSFLIIVARNVWFKYK